MTTTEYIMVLKSGVTLKARCPGSPLEGHEKNIR